MPLHDYITISGFKPKYPARKIGVNWLGFKQPFSKWPADMKRKWKKIITFLDSDEADNQASETPQFICLCAEIGKCPYKESFDENKNCHKYAFGVCVDATMQVNNGQPLNFNNVAILCGLTKQRIHQIYVKAQQKLIKEIKKDPVLRDYCESFRIGEGNGV